MRRKTAMCWPLSLKSSGAVAARPNGSTGVCRTENVCKMRYREGQTPRTRVRKLVAPLRYENENTPISDAFTSQVRQALDNLRDKRGVTVRFIGYTDDASLTGLD